MLTRQIVPIGSYCPTLSICPSKWEGKSVILSSSSIIDPNHPTFIFKAFSTKPKTQKPLTQRSWLWEWNHQRQNLTPTPPSSSIIDPNHPTFIFRAFSTKPKTQKPSTQWSWLWKWNHQRQNPTKPQNSTTTIWLLGRIKPSEETPKTHKPPSPTPLYNHPRS